MFSPENLERLAAVIDEPFEGPEDEETQKDPCERINVRAKVTDNGDVIIPVNFSFGKVKTNLQLVFKIDAKDFSDADKIKDRPERIKKLTSSFKIVKPTITFQ